MARVSYLVKRLQQAVCSHIDSVTVEVGLTHAAQHSAIGELTTLDVKCCKPTQCVISDDTRGNSSPR